MIDYKKIVSEQLKEDLLWSEFGYVGFTEEEFVACANHIIEECAKVAEFEELNNEGRVGVSVRELKIGGE